MRARYRSICPACRQRIRLGERIRCLARGTCHESCTRELTRRRPPELDDRTRRALEAAERAGFR